MNAQRTDNAATANSLLYYFALIGGLVLFVALPFIAIQQPWTLLITLPLIVIWGAWLLGRYWKWVRTLGK